MVADLLEMDGWDSFFLGGNLCTQHALQAITRWPPDLLGLSVTIPYYVASARELVLAVRSERSLAAVKILVGGQALNAAPGIWKDLGADGWARNLEECVDAANGLVGEKQ
jgi:methanogenic corrinoid protein MtbC1